ncbi:putative uncharacterized protein DDB_G0282129 isoform X2 [Condylostylus longicornis]|uniref:putative uncharacterized protein DDB_G0282129 isoform X2 n=1 Tax=Condylostylus longicornis TaxID=2530218 RepID=UPI00244DA9E9|nr:putative uncharacterized protein DDB_G0282129 isoform X2 [Condylostylus longicornis]
MDCNITTNPFRSLDIDSKFNNKNSNIFHNNNKNSSISLSSISLSQQPSSASTSGASSSSLLKKSKNNNDTSIQQLAGTSTTTTSSSSIFDQNFYNKISNIYQENSIQSLSSLSPALATTTTENTFLSQESSPPMKTSTISIAPSSLSSSSTSSSSLAAASELINLSKKLYGSTIENDNTTNYKCDYLEYNKESLLLTSLPTTSSITLKPLQLDEKCYEQITNPYNKHIRCNSTSNEITNNTTTDSIKTQLLLSSSSSLLSSSPFNLTDMNKTTITIATTASTLNTTTIQQNLSKINCTTKSPLTKTKMMEFHARIQLLENAMNFRDHTQTITTTAAPVTVTPNQQQQTTINGAATTTIQTSPKKITPQKLNFYQTKKEIEQMLGQRFNLNDHQSYNHNNTVPLSSSSTTVTTTTTTTATGTIGITTKFTNNNQTTKRRLTNLINTSSLDLSKNNSMNTIYNNSNINDNSNIISLTNNTGNNETTNNINNASDEKDHFKNLSKDKISLQNKLQEEMKRQCQKIQEKHSIERYPPQYHYGEIHNSTLNFHSFPESSSKIGQHQLKQIKTSTIGTGRGGATSTSTNKGGTVTTTTTVIDENFLVYRDGILISGPLESLIKHMVPTSNYYPENSFIFAFLLSARLFINPYELLQRICQLCEEQQNIIVKLQQTKAKNSTDNNSLLSSTLASSSSSSTSSSSTSTSGICSGSVGVGSSLNNGRNCINIMNDNCNGINDNNVTGNSSTSTATTATRTSPNNRVNTNIKSKSNNNSNNSNIITNHNTNLRQLQKQQPYNQDNQTDTKTLLKMFAKNFLRLLNEWVNLFPYDFRDERLMQQVRTMQQKCISIDSNLRQDVSIILQNLLEKLTVLETYENFLQSLSNSDATDFTNNMNSGISSSSNNDKDHHYYPHNLTSSNSLVMPVTTIPSSTVTTGAAALTTATTSSSSLSFHHHITGLIPSYTNHSMSSSSIGSMASINGGVEIIEICPSSTVLSQQLTHIELERLSHIGPEEFVQVFAKENINLTENHKSSNTNNIKGASSETPLNADVKKTRNLETYVHWFNRLSYLVATEIVKYSKKKQRVRVVEYWIETARECFNIGNFNSLMAIIAGLNMSPISRLKKTWAKVQSAKFSVLEHQMDPSSNFNSYRSTLKAAMWRSAGATNEREKIIIPFFSLLVKDLYFLNEGCSNRLSNGHINFEKFWQVSKQIKEFISWKEVTCPFERDQKTIMYLQRNPILNENTLAIASFECEPPENQQEKERFKGLKIEILQYNNSNIGLGNNINSGNNSNNPGCSGSNNTNTGNTNNSHINQTIPTTN